jgi:hypothetical protein
MRNTGRFLRFPDQVIVRTPTGSVFGRRQEPAPIQKRLKIECQLWLLVDGSIGHVAERHERFLPGVAMENPKAAGGVHPLWVSKSRTLGKLRWPLVISDDDLKLQTACSKADDQYGHPSQNAGELNSFQL